MIYVVALLRWKDREAYRRYQQAFMTTLAGTGGRLLAADEAPRLVEGTWAGDKVVLLAFPEGAGFRRWESSPGYKAIVGDRRAGADATILLVQGLG